MSITIKTSWEDIVQRDFAYIEHLVDNANVPCGDNERRSAWYALRLIRAHLIQTSDPLHCLDDASSLWMIARNCRASAHIPQAAYGEDAVQEWALALANHVRADAADVVGSSHDDAVYDVCIEDAVQELGPPPWEVSQRVEPGMKFVSTSDGREVVVREVRVIHSSQSVAQVRFACVLTGEQWWATVEAFLQGFRRV